MRRVLVLSAIALVIVLVVSFFAFMNGAEEPGEEGLGQGNIFDVLFPFDFGGLMNGGTPEPSVEEPVVGERPAPALRNVSNAPSSGGFVFDDEGDVRILYVERETGHVFEATPENLTVQRVSNTTIPGVQEVLWASGGSFVLRYLEKELVRNFHAKLVATGTEAALQGSFLSSFARGALDPSGETLLSVTETANGDASVTLSNIDGSNSRVVFTSPIRSWIPLQTDEGLYLQTAPASGIPGFLYRVTGGVLDKVLGSVPGLTAHVSRSGEWVLAGSGNSDAFSLIAFNTETGEVFDSPVATIPEKCAFVSENPLLVACGVPSETPSGNYPDDWLLGRVSFTDDLWLLRPEEGSAELLAVPEDDAGTALDVSAAKVGGGYFSFINKKDLSFWTLKLPE